VRTSPDAFVERGRAKEGKGDRRAAIEDFRKALAINPDYAEARGHLTRLGEK
jgi:tetratricopeptide (TPR) repeat protein